MSTWSLATLKSAVEGAVADTSATFASDLSTLIGLAEDMCIVDLNLETHKANDVITLTISTQLATLPTGFLRLNSLFYTSSGTRSYLDPKSYEYLIDYWPVAATTGTPLYWAPYSTTEIYIAPTPSATVTGTGRGVKRPTSLITDTSGTWLSQNCGNLLYNACLVVSEQFNLADERIAMWKAEYAEELARKSKELRHLMSPEFDFPAWPVPQYLQPRVGA